MKEFPSFGQITGLAAGQNRGISIIPLGMNRLIEKAFPTEIVHPAMDATD